MSRGGSCILRRICAEIKETGLCSITITESGRGLKLKKGDPVWALFNSFAVVLHVD